MSTKTLAKGWIPDTTSFAARIALVRREMGWNLKEASLECGLQSSNSWGNWESGAQPRDYMDAVDRIATRTQVSRMWLMVGERPPLDYKAQVLPITSGRKSRPANRTDTTRPRAA